MARVLIQMRAAIMRRAFSGERWIGILLLALLVTLLAVASWRAPCSAPLSPTSP